MKINLTTLAWRTNSVEGTNIIIRNDPETNNTRNLIRANDIEVQYDHLHGLEMEDDFRWTLYHMTGDLRTTTNCVRENSEEIEQTQQVVAYSENLNEINPVSDVLIGNEGNNAFRHLCFIFEHKGNNDIPKGSVSRDDETSFDGVLYVDFNTAVGRSETLDWSQQVTARIALSNVR